MKDIKVIKRYSVPKTEQEKKDFNEFYDLEEARLKQEQEMQDNMDEKLADCPCGQPVTESGDCCACGYNPESCIDESFREGCKGQVAHGCENCGEHPMQYEMGIEFDYKKICKVCFDADDRCEKCFLEKQHRDSEQQCKCEVKS